MFELIAHHSDKKPVLPIKLFHREGITDVDISSRAPVMPPHRILRSEGWLDEKEIRRTPGLVSDWKLSDIYAIVRQIVDDGQVVGASFIREDDTIQYYLCNFYGPTIWGYKYHAGTPSFSAPRRVIVARLE